MEFLKGIISDELYSKLEGELSKYNTDEANKDKQIKLGNLGSGEYVAKGKFDSETAKIQALLDSKTSELETANGLIADMKKATKGNEELQGKITTYESTIQTLQNELQETKIKYAIRDALRSEKAIDVDYLTFKLESKLKDDGAKIELDENENIKGWNDMISGLKTQFPTQFEGAGAKKIEEHKLDEKKEDSTFTRAELLKKSYAERQQIFESNPEAYTEAMKN